MKNEISVKQLLGAIILFIFVQSSAQKMTGSQLLEKAIEYHDPNRNWNTFKGNLFITMEIPNKSNIESDIFIDLSKEIFELKSRRSDNTSEYLIEKDSVSITFNGKTNLSENELQENKLSSSRGKMLKNYYTYLYGLPMKLKDPGTIIHENVEDKVFHGKSYWVLKVTYDEDVGSDKWYFYFDKSNYKMEVYQFYKDESKNDGEYILLSEEEIINGIKMPKIRAWYTNDQNELLGTDIINPSPSK